jgi:signal transduction histidine kinase
VIDEKTDGNPLFAIRFLTTPVGEELLAFDPVETTWTWELPRIQAKGFINDVAELMAVTLSHYEAGIHPAREHGFVQAISNELAASFYAGRRFATIANAYLPAAHYRYLRWGAGSKLRHLDELYPMLHPRPTHLVPTATTGAHAMLWAPEAISAEIVLGSLIETLMRSAIEHAGAECGALYLENSLSPGVLASDRDSVLEILAAQAAISPESTWLCSDLRRGGAFLADGQRMSRTGTWRRNPSTGKIRWTDEHRIFDFDPAQKNGRKLGSFLARVHPDDMAEVRQKLEIAIESETGIAFDFRLSLPDGSVKYVHRAGRPISGESRNTREFAGTTIDITEREIGEDALRNAQADLARAARLATMGELTALIAHEVSQPLMAIVTNADACVAWLTNATPNLEEARRAAERIVANGHRAGAIIKGIRALARKAEPEMAALDINDAISEILAWMDGELHRVQLQQVVLNLIVNGIEAMADVTNRPRTLRISTRTDPSRLLVAVADAGTGLDPANVDRIFDGFFTTKLEGIGMGLAISRSIIEAHGGALWAAPNQPHGSVFQFTIPGVVERKGGDNGS